MANFLAVWLLSIPLKMVLFILTSKETMFFPYLTRICLLYTSVNEMLLGLMKECRGLTVLTIAHRESSLAYCPRVIRLNGKDNGSNL